MVIRRLLSVAFGLIAISGLASCTQEECARNYGSASEQRACMDGSNQIAPQVISRVGSIPSREQALRECRAECVRRFNTDDVSPEDSGFFDRTLRLADLQTACQDSCRAQIELERDRAEAWDNYVNTPGCAEVHIGGWVRCY